jgi:hypothetical protein
VRWIVLLASFGIVGVLAGGAVDYTRKESQEQRSRDQFEVRCNVGSFERNPDCARFGYECREDHRTVACVDTAAIEHDWQTRRVWYGVAIGSLVILAAASAFFVRTGRQPPPG